MQIIFPIEILKIVSFLVNPLHQTDEIEFNHDQTNFSIRICLSSRQNCMPEIIDSISIILIKRKL